MVAWVADFDERPFLKTRMHGHGAAAAASISFDRDLPHPRTARLTDQRILTHQAWFESHVDVGAGLVDWQRRGRGRFEREQAYVLSDILGRDDLGQVPR